MEKYIIYIGRKLKSIDGGAIVSKRNVEMLREISQNKIVEFYLSHDSSFIKLKNVLTGKPWGYSREVYREIKTAIENKDVSLIFIDHSLLGGFAGILKKFSHKVVMFFHNIEIKYYDDKVLVDGKLNKLMVRYAKMNEKPAVKYADKIICLTDKDSNLLYSIYGRKADLVLPITIDDKFDVAVEAENNKNYHLFVGSYFFANIDAINWYTQNVLPFVDSKLIIIGNGMDAMSKQFAGNPKVEIKGFVDDLHPFYSNADFVINPVRLGSGMKTKTIEALMYGKTVIGTEDAFVGMNAVEDCGIGLICSSASEFIERINKFKGTKFNLHSRHYYLNNFSAEVGSQKLSNFLTR